MKQVFILVLMLLVVATVTESYAQAPQSFKYQSIARNGDDVLLSDADINLEISIHDLTPTGTVVYKERHSVTTNSLGLFTISVGGGTVVSGIFATIPWGDGSKFIEVASDFTGETNFTSMGTSQLLSVPYSLHSGNSWGLFGNSGTFDGAQFIGTTDDVGLNFKVNNEKSGYITSLGHTFFGYKAGKNNVNPNNTGIGYKALESNTNGNQNTAIGNGALQNNTTGSFNIAVGSDALGNNTNDLNIAIGISALRLNQGTYNTALGNNSLYSNLVGTANTAIGNATLYENQSGFSNSALGNAALYSNQTGYWNTAVGEEALLSNTTGNSNTAVGRQADVALGSLTNATAIGNLAIVNASNKVRIGNGAVTVVEVPVAVTIASDQRLKENIIDSELGLEFITKIRPVQYTMKTGNGKTDYGFIAQELKEVLGDRNVNMLNKDGEYYHVRYNDLIAPMVKAIQEQQQLIDQLKAELNTMKSELENKDSENTALKSTVEDRLKRLEATVVANTQN